ncbi:MAG TPA: four helix bundle protein [Sedimentisphaerales bacterium]|nr:four helix bundle protein [Sedimentisphaerales bacterium]
MAQSIARQKSYDFAVLIVDFCAKLKGQRQYEIACQLLRSGTSIGANVEEALAGSSRKDFFAKMCIASKEDRETNYWLRLIRDTAITDDVRTETLIELSEELIKILTSIVKTGYGDSKPDTNAKMQN